MAVLHFFSVRYRAQMRSIKIMDIRNDRSNALPPVRSHLHLRPMKPIRNHIRATVDEGKRGPIRFDSLALSHIHLHAFFSNQNASDRGQARQHIEEL
jgi:hypothetical protein